METFNEKAERLKKESEELGTYEEIHNEIANAHNYFAEHTKKRAGTLKKYIGMVRRENYLRIQEEIEDKAFIIKSRKEKKERLARVREIKKRPVLETGTIFMNHLHQSIKRSNITSEMEQKEVEFGMDFKDRI